MLQLETIQGDTLHICHIALFLFQIFGCRRGRTKVSLDYLSGCLDCCNWKRFKETTRTTGIAHTSHLSLFFPSDIWLKRGAQVGNKMITSVVISLLTFFGLLSENQAVLRLQVRRFLFFGCSCLFSHREIICCKYCLCDL